MTRDDQTYDDFPSVLPPTPEELAAMTKWAKDNNLTIGVDENGMPTYTHDSVFKVDKPRRFFKATIE